MTLNWILWLTPFSYFRFYFFYYSCIVDFRSISSDSSLNQIWFNICWSSCLLIHAVEPFATQKEFIESNYGHHNNQYIRKQHCRGMELRVGNKYRLGRKIGAGSFGDIYLGTTINTGEEVLYNFLRYLKTNMWCSCLWIWFLYSTRNLFISSFFYWSNNQNKFFVYNSQKSSYPKVRIPYIWLEINLLSERNILLFFRYNLEIEFVLYVSYECVVKKVKRKEQNANTNIYKHLVSLFFDALRWRPEKKQKLKRFY